MHLWNIKSVTDEINSGQMTETKAFGYLFLTVGLNSIAFLAAAYFGISTPLANLPFGFVVPLLKLAILIGGMLIIFRSFQRNHGREFVQKFICLLVPASLRAFAFCLPLYIVAGVIAYQFPMQDRHSVLAMINGVILTLMDVVQFVIIYRNMLLVSTASTNLDIAAA